MTATFVISIQPHAATLLIECSSEEPGFPHPYPNPAMRDQDGVGTAPVPGDGLSLSASAEPEAAPPLPHPLDNENEFARYRGQTTYLLRRYLRQSIQIGRLPNILGREIMPARAS